MATPDQNAFGKYIIFNLVSVIDWQVITAAKQQQVGIDNVQENARQFMHDYAIGDQFYMEMTGLYRKLDYKKQVLYIITEFFTNGTVQFQQGQLNERINMR